MANLTKAQRHNKMLNDTFETYRKQQEAKKDLLPTCQEYSFFLDKAVEKLKITIDEARSKFGLFTYGQWKETLGLF
jgi:hypothetical protein